MAAPKVFVSSTWYDLRYIRENLKYFIKSLGYEPILSEEGSVFFDPKLHVQDACIAELPNCQILVLIIGGRYGSSFRETPKSVTNAEFREAARLKIPIFALVEQGVYSDLQVYTSNRGNERLIAEVIFPSVDSTLVFEFIEEVRTNAVNNALVPFRDFADIESYLKQQWAGMMFSFLAGKNEKERVADTLSVMQEMSERIEMLSRQILNSVGTDHAKVTAAVYDAMMVSEITRNLQDWGWRVTPAAVLQSKTVVDCAKTLGKVITVLDDEGRSKLDEMLESKSIIETGFSTSAYLDLSSRGSSVDETKPSLRPRTPVPDFAVTSAGSIYVSPRFLAKFSKDYTKMRKELLRILGQFGISVPEYLKRETTVSAVAPTTRRAKR